MTTRFKLKQLDYLLLISMCDSRLGLCPHQLLHDRNLKLIIYCTCNCLIAQSKMLTTVASQSIP